MPEIKANKTNQHGSLKSIAQKTRNTFNAQLFETLEATKTLQ